MTRWVQLSAILPVLIGTALLATVIVALVRQPRPVCRGPSSWRGWLPWCWFGHSCGYDLKGLPICGGRVRCPECGTAQALRSRRNLRVLPRLVGVLSLTVLAAACWRVSWTRYGGWATYTPTTLLIWADYLPMPRRVEVVLSDRTARGKLWGWQRRQLAGLAVHRLGNDRRRRNASWAMSTLNDLGSDAVSETERGLESPDRQRRQLCAQFLRARVYGGRRYADGVGPPEPYDPPQRLFEVSVEGLADDDLKDYNNAYSGLGFLIAYPERAHPLLEAALKQNDQQQRFLAALVAATIRAEDLAPLAAPVLVSRLGRNHKWGDARIAAPALLGFGDAGRPYLLAALNSGDPQAASLAMLIARAIDHQAMTFEEREALKQVTREYTDLREAFERGRGPWARLDRWSGWD